jgi:hypothetical protein
MTKMVYDGAVSAIKHGAVFAAVGIVITNLVITILMPFFAYVILKTAAMASRKVIFDTMTICKDTTVFIVKTQVKTCKATLAVVSTLTNTSIEMTKLLIRQTMNTMRRLVGIGQFYARRSMDIVLNFKDVAFLFVKKGLVLIRSSLNVSISTIRKLAEMVLTLLTRAPEQLYKLIEVIFTKIFPGFVKIMIYFPQQYFMFMTKILPGQVNFIFKMCRLVVDLNVGATSLIVFFHLVSTGVKFVGKFFNIGKQFVGDFVAGINGILDVIPSFGEILDSDTVASIPDKLISFVLYDLNFTTGLNVLLNATTTTLPSIEAKESAISDKGIEINILENERNALAKQIEISPDPEKSLEISRLNIVIDGFQTQLNILKQELSTLELNRKFTFDELYLRLLFSVISLFNVYTVPPPIPPMIKILMDFLFLTNITPPLTIDVGFSDTWGFDEYASITINVSASFTIRAIKIADFFPNATSAISSFVDWLDGRLRSEDAYETVDGKKKSKLRAITRNPAAFVKFILKILVKWMEYIFDALGINLENFISVSFSASTDLDTFIPDELEDLIDIVSPPVEEVLQFFTGFTDGSAWVFSRAINYVVQFFGSLLGYFLTAIFDYTQTVIFAGLNSTYPSDDFDWL